MFIQDYIQLLLKRWWLVALAFGVVFSATYVWTSRQVPVYESSATFVIRPRSESVLGNDFIRALDTISNRSEINLTFAEVSSSNLIHLKAIEKLGLTAAEQSGLSARGRIITGTNILEITAKSHDPIIARRFADAVGVEAMAYVGNLYDVYQMEVLDTANTPPRPTSPNTNLNLFLGASLGLALGAALVFMLESLKPAYKEMDTFNIVDRDTGAYNKSYFSHRLFQEMARVKNTKSSLSLGLVKVNFNGDELSESEKVEALRMVKILTEKTVREEDILARFNGTTFAIIFPDMELRSARSSLENIRNVIGSVAHDMNPVNGNHALGSNMGAVAYTGGRLDHEQLVEQALKDLNQSAPE
jgi:diguanylate cyclase (GGDEF)-like protein